MYENLSCIYQKREITFVECEHELTKKLLN